MQICNVHIYDCFFSCVGSLNEIIKDTLFRSLDQIYISKDSTHTEFVLVFHVTSITPFENKYCNTVKSIFQIVRYIKFTSRMRYLTVSNILPIQPYIKTRVYSFEVEICSWCQLISRIFEIIYICSTRIIMWYIWRIKRKRITDIRVLMRIIACALPYTRHYDLIKQTYIVIQFIKMFL